MAKNKQVRVEKSYGPYALGFEDLKELIDEFSQLENPSFECDLYYDDVKLTFSGTREENADERKQRLEKAKKERERQAALKLQAEQKEREQLKKLLEKYGPCCGEDLYYVES